eukprot:scaffold610_cov352-Pavlova_lutheri.AAC.11
MAWRSIHASAWGGWSPPPVADTCGRRQEHANTHPVDRASIDLWPKKSKSKTQRNETKPASAWKVP